MGRDGKQRRFRRMYPVAIPDDFVPQVKVIAGDALTELRRLPYCSTHCCITSPAYYLQDDYNDDRQIGRKRLPTNTSSGSSRCSPRSVVSLNAMVLSGRLRYIKMALGFHPLAVAKQDCELDQFLRLMPEVTHVGEIGLDFLREGLGSKNQQLAAFRAIIKAVSGIRKFVSLYSRGAEETVLAILDEFQVKMAVFHWYSGPLTVLDRAIEAGFYFSVNPAMIRSEKGQRILTRIPRDRVLTETDGPYVRVVSRPAEPRDVAEVIKFLATVWGDSVEDASARVLDNYRQIVP